MHMCSFTAVAMHTFVFYGIILIDALTRMIIFEAACSTMDESK